MHVSVLVRILLSPLTQISSISDQIPHPSACPSWCLITLTCLKRESHYVNITRAPPLSLRLHLSNILSIDLLPGSLAIKPPTFPYHSWSWAQSLLYHKTAAGESLCLRRYLLNSAPWCSLTSVADKFLTVFKYSHVLFVCWFCFWSEVLEVRTSTSELEGHSSPGGDGELDGLFEDLRVLSNSAIKEARDQGLGGRWMEAWPGQGDSNGGACMRGAASRRDSGFWKGWDSREAAMRSKDNQASIPGPEAFGNTNLKMQFPPERLSEPW